MRRPPPPVDSPEAYVVIVLAGIAIVALAGLAGIITALIL